jgi:hypothetical protein
VTESAPVTSNIPSTPVPTPTPTETKTPEKPITPTSLELEEGQLKEFFTELGTKAGHGGWKPEQIEAMVQNLKGIKKGDSKSGSLHIDHQGGHEDVMMTVERPTEAKYRITFSGGSASLFDSLKPVLGAFDKAAK